MQSLLKFFGRQPAAPLIRARVYARIKLIEQLAVNEQLTVTTPPFDFESMCAHLRVDLKETVSRERELKLATIQAFPGDQELLSKVSKISSIRHEFADEIAFLWRAHKLGFSHDNLTIAVNTAETTRNNLHFLLNEYQETLLKRIEATAQNKLSCFFI